MHVNGLGYDILHHLFFILANGYYLKHGGDYQKLIGISSTCRYWRSFLLPYLYGKLYIETDRVETQSNARRIHSSGHSRYTRMLEINLYDVFVDSSDFVAILKDAGIEETIWPRITTLEVKSAASFNGDLGHYHGDAFAAKEIADIFSKHLPCVKEIKSMQSVANDQWERDSLYPCHLVPELTKRYSNRLCKVGISVFAEYLSAEYPLPQVLTHLDIDMNSFEKRMLASVLAPSLQQLRLSCVSSDITWGWFDSGNGNDVWFSKLRKLVVQFSAFDIPRVAYHDRDLSGADFADLQTEYDGVRKYVYFPVLEELKVDGYPYYDDSFYRVFNDCPLKEIDMRSPRGVRNFLPSQMLTSLRRINVAIEPYEWSFQIGGSDHGPEVPAKASNEQAVSHLLSSQSAAHSACLTLYCSDMISLPDAIGWTSIQRLKLEFYIDMGSLYTVLAQMPKLRHLQFCMPTAYLNRLYTENAGANEQARQQLSVANKCVEYLGFESDDHLPKSCLRYALSSILPLVPSLLKLKVNWNSVDDIRDMISDPDSLPGSVSQQLEIVCY